MTGHFANRVRERIGPDADPWLIYDSIRRAIEEGRTDLVSYEGRQSRNGHRKFRFRYIDGREFFAVLNTTQDVALTVYAAEEGSS